VILVALSDLWRAADEASERFAAQALDYDRYRPRYPEGVFDDLVESVGLEPGNKVVEIGAGTGIATEPLVERGLDVTAIEPAIALVAIAEAKVADRVHFFRGRFEEFSADSPVRMLAAFNAWHWVEPGRGIELAARLVEPGGTLALVWTEVLSWGEDPFEQHLAEVFGTPWERRMQHVDGSMQPIREDARFGEFQDHHHPFERTLDASTFIAVTKTYGGNYTAEQFQAIEQIINEDFGGVVRKVEDAAIYLSIRL
jgi:trans-aconitate methyltransferase